MDGGASGEENGTETPRAMVSHQQEEAGWEMVDHDVPVTPAPTHRVPPPLGWFRRLGIFDHRIIQEN